MGPQRAKGSSGSEVYESYDNLENLIRKIMAELCTLLTLIEIVRCNPGGQRTESGPASEPNLMVCVSTPNFLYFEDTYENQGF